MRIPRVNAVGLTDYPPGYSTQSYRPRLAIRILAAVLVVLFAATVVSTTIVSVGSYCLTSDGGDTRHLPR